MKLSLDKQGRAEQLLLTPTFQDHLLKDSSAYFLTLYADGQQHFPSSLRFNRSDNMLSFKFREPGVSVEVRFSEKGNYLTFEVVKAEPAGKIEAIQWGPLFTTISEKVGEVAGVVRDDKTAFGMLLLNIETLGGEYNRNGICEGRGCLARPLPGGSSLQAYTINRDRRREVSAMGHDHIPLNPLNGKTVKGSRIALFSCDQSGALDVMEQIVIAEKLPYPTYKGVWTKKAFLHSPSYLISDFKEDEIDEVIGYAKRGGFFSVYHEGPFKTWGHYELNHDYFPNGKNGIRACAEKAKANGLLFGVHTLTNFITTEDAYVTPVPDKRLAITGYGLLEADLDGNATELIFNTGYPFSENNNNLHTILIGDELIQYTNATFENPSVLSGCKRGAFGTIAAPHHKNDTVRKLADHAYKVFFPNLDLQREIAVNLARFFNETGISHLDFDGHEGCQASGEGDYAESLFADDFFRTLDHEFVNGTSRSKSYYWYINTLCNWGEPWYGGFNESMQEYRISNQAMLERNYFPNMLGWYMLTKNTTLTEMEWMLARSAGYNAGFAMVARMKDVRGNPEALTLLDTIREWESARLAGAFSEEQKERLKNPANAFHLEKIVEKEWNLVQVNSGKSERIKGK